MSLLLNFVISESLLLGGRKRKGEERLERKGEGLLVVTRVLADTRAEQRIVLPGDF